MHKLIQVFILFAVLTFAEKSEAQIVNIPDSIFRAKLLQVNNAPSVARNSLGQEVKIDANNDGYIQESEVSNPTIFSLNLGNYVIKSLEGIQYFKNIQELICYSNQLTDLNVSNCTKLRTLQCGDNLLATLNVGGLVHLESIYCSINRLTFLNLNGLTGLTGCVMSSNPLLNTVYMKNVSTNFAYSSAVSFMTGLPSLHYICADPAGLVQLRGAVNSLGYTNVIINSDCNSYLNGTFYMLKGKVKFDMDNNGCTANDINFPNLKMKVKNGIDSSYSISDIQGDFDVDLNPGTYNVAPSFSNNYFISTPSSATITLPDSISPVFCITPNGTHNDLSVSIIPIRGARPGFSDATYKIVYKNKGTTNQSGTILFNYDENRQDYISATATPTNIASGTLTFSFTNLIPFETREIIVTMRTNAPTDIPPVNTNDILQLSVTLNLANSVHDDWFKDNFQLIKQTVIGSFDPNDKTCLEGSIITPTLVGDFVNYLIRFENTGTANAENIVVTDFIDLAKFDISTLELTSTSHNCKTVISNGNKVQFVFDNIQLPFTEPDKHGYVAFKIKTKNNLVIGDSLTNKADIYFDYNLPIITNTATTKITNVTAIKNSINKEGSLSVYPNPGNGNFTVNFESKGNYPITIRVTDLNGKTLYEQKNVHHERTNAPIELQDLPNGMYQLHILADKDVWIQKLLIVK